MSWGLRGVDCRFLAGLCACLVLVVRYCVKLGEEEFSGICFSFCVVMKELDASRFFSFFAMIFYVGKGLRFFEDI